MDRVSCADIDRHALADNDYRVILNARKSPNAAISGVDGGPVVSFPYALAMVPLNKHPSLLRFFLENLYSFMVEKDSARTGLVVVEDEEGWFEQKKLGWLQKPVRARYHGLDFDWEPVEIYNGALPSLAKANATVVRDARDRSGVVRFKVKRVRGVSPCGSDCAASVRIEKVWQFVEAHRVTTFCATRDPLRFLEDESVVEVRGVHPEIDGHHVVEEVFLEGDQYECSCFCFNGCQLLGNILDEDTYLLWDKSGAPSTNAWAAERCRVEREGLYHIRITPPDDRYQAVSAPSGARWQEEWQHGRDKQDIPMHSWGGYPDSVAGSYADQEASGSMSHNYQWGGMATTWSNEQCYSYGNSHDDSMEWGKSAAAAPSEPPPVRHPLARPGEAPPAKEPVAASVGQPSPPVNEHPAVRSGELTPLRGHPMAESSPTPSHTVHAAVSERPSQPPGMHPLATCRESSTSFVKHPMASPPPPARHPMAAHGELASQAGELMTGSGEVQPTPAKHPLGGFEKPLLPPHSTSGALEPPPPPINGYAVYGSGHRPPPANVHSLAGSRQPSPPPNPYPVAGSRQSSPPPSPYPAAATWQPSPPPDSHTMVGSRETPPTPSWNIVERARDIRPPSPGTHPSGGYMGPPGIVPTSGEAPVKPLSQPGDSSPISLVEAGPPPPPQAGSLPFHHLPPPPPSPQPSKRHGSQPHALHPPPPLSPRSLQGYATVVGPEDRTSSGDCAEQRPVYPPHPPPHPPPLPVLPPNIGKIALPGAPQRQGDGEVEKENKGHAEGKHAPTPAIPTIHPKALSPAVQPPPAPLRMPSMPPGLLPASRQELNMPHPHPYARHNPELSKQGYAADRVATRPAPSTQGKQVAAASGHGLRDKEYTGHQPNGGETRPSTPGERGHMELRDLSQDLSQLFPTHSIFNKSRSTRSASGSIRCQSPASSHQKASNANRDTAKRVQVPPSSSFATRSTGTLDDTRLPKSPRLYEQQYHSQPNSPRSTSPQPILRGSIVKYGNRQHTAQLEGKAEEMSGGIEKVGPELTRKAPPRSNHQRYGEGASGISDHGHPKAIAALMDSHSQGKRARTDDMGGKEIQGVKLGSGAVGDAHNDPASQAFLTPVPAVPGLVPGLNRREERQHPTVPPKTGDAELYSMQCNGQLEKGSSESEVMPVAIPGPLPTPVPARAPAAPPVPARAPVTPPVPARAPAAPPVPTPTPVTPPVPARTPVTPPVPTPTPAAALVSARAHVALPVPARTPVQTPIPVPLPALVLCEGTAMQSRKRSASPNGSDAAASDLQKLPVKDGGIHHAEIQSHRSRSPSQKLDQRGPSRDLPTQKVHFEALEIPAVPKDRHSLEKMEPHESALLPTPIINIPRPSKLPSRVRSSERPATPVPAVEPLAIVPVERLATPIPKPVLSVEALAAEEEECLPKPLQQLPPRQSELLDLPVPVMKSEPDVLGVNAPQPLPSLTGIPALQRDQSGSSLEDLPQRMGAHLASTSEEGSISSVRTPRVAGANSHGNGSVIVTDRPKPAQTDWSKLSTGSLEMVKKSVDLKTDSLRPEQWQIAVDSLMKKKPAMVPGSLQKLSPDNPELSGLAGPRCSEAQLESAALKFRAVVDSKVRERIGGILCGGSDRDSWVRTCQRLIETIGNQLPSVIMQRGDYLYVVPKMLTPIISEALHTLDIPASSMGGVLLLLFDAIGSVYREVRIRISTGQVEETPAQIYQDLEMDAIQKMNQPTLAEPQFKSDETGKIQMKVFPGTCVLQPTPNTPFESTSKVPMPVKLAGWGSSSVCSNSSTSLAGSVSLPRTSTQEALTPIPAAAPQVGDSSSSLAAQSLPLPSPSLLVGHCGHGGSISSASGGGGSAADVFKGFEISDMQNKTSTEIAEIVSERLMLNKGLHVEFLEGWLEDPGKDVFLERFLRLRSSKRATPADAPAALAPLLGGLTPPGLGVQPNLAPLPQEPMRLPTITPDLKPIPGLLGGNLASLAVPTPIPIRPTPAGGLIQSMINTPGGINEEMMAQLIKLSGQVPNIVQRSLAQPKFMNKIKDYFQGERPSQPLRKYQAQCVEKAEGGGNYIFVAPTGSGKTKIFVECTRRLLKRQPDAKIVVICPTVPLASQQAAVFVFEGFIEEGYSINAFSGENQLCPVMWKHARMSYHVMVMTPQILLSILDEEQGGFHEIDLLVLDECHHCRGDHPYSKIMDHYRKGLLSNQERAQVLGFTASPAKSSTLEQACAEMQQLLEKTNAECVVINEDNKEVQQHVPSAEEETLYIEPREEDQHFSMCMGKFLFNACAQVVLELIEETPCLPPITQQAMVDLNCGVHSPAFENWCKKSVEELVRYPTLSDRRKQILRASIELLRACNITLDLVKEGGFEVALRTISKSITQINLDMSQVEKAQETIYSRLSLGLYNISPIRNVTMLARAFHMTDNGGDYRSFPRFVAIVRFLEQYKHQESFHGIIFCRTRDAVYSLTDMLRQTPALYFVQAMPFIGHGRTTRRSSKGMKLDGNNAALAVRGMTGTQQRDVLTRFQSPGRHVLVSTRAAEEGINVTTCAFVVRYSVTETGIERIQSRGRTRVDGGKFVNIVEKESKEGKMFLKSVKEEATMNQVLKLFANAHHVV